MSNDEFPPPTPPDGSETGLGDLASGPGNGAPMPPTPPPIDSTQVMPVTPTLPPTTPGAPPPTFGGVAPGAPGHPGSPVVPTERLPKPPWFKRPGAVAAVVTGVLLVGGVIALLFLLGGDDDEGGSVLEPEPVSFVLVRNSSAGGALSTTISAVVTVQEPAADAYAWIVPGDGIVGQPATRETDATGRTEFRWAPLADADAATWSSTVEFAEFVASERDAAVTGFGADCILERDGSTETLVITADVRPDEVDALTGIGSYTFPNVRFRAGDRVECTLVNQVATPPPTTVPESTTTVPESTTTVPETTTTVPETTTTVPETTTTTTTTTTLAPSDPSLGDALDSLGLTETKALLEQVGLLAEIEALDQPFTLFAPDNAAIDDLRNDPDGPDLTDDAIVEDLLRAHLSVGDSLSLSELAGLPEIAVEFGGPQTLDAGASPPTIGPAEITDPDQAVDGGVVHVIDVALDPQP